MTIPASTVQQQDLACDPGDKVLGGGYQIESDVLFPRASKPTSSALEGWSITMRNNGGGSTYYIIYAVCATI